MLYLSSLTAIIIVCTRVYIQAEAEVQAKERKIKLLETDLDAAEDTAADYQAKSKEYEQLAEDAERENQRLKRDINQLEGIYNIRTSGLHNIVSCVCLCCNNVCMCLSNFEGVYSCVDGM